VRVVGGAGRKLIGASHLRVRARVGYGGFVERPGKFEEFRWVGDKRSLVVYDVDSMTDTAIIDELMEAGTYICFGPDTLAEARNRGYRPFNGTGTNR
jgi:hypothetical protein